MYLIIDEFCIFLKDNRNYSDQTISIYKRSLILLDSRLQDVSFGSRGVDIPSTIDLQDVEEFASHQRLLGKSVRTVNNYLAGIRAFLKFCIHKGLEVLDYRRILFAREPRQKIHALTTEEMEKLIKYMRNDKSKDEITRMRDYAIVLLMNYGGLRVSEISKLKTIDIKEKMMINGKGQVNRLVYLYSDHVKVIELYLFLRRRLHINSDFVFVSHSNNSKGEPLSRATIDKIIKDASEKAGISKTRPHKLRHTCATQMLEHGGDIVYISQILGHKDLKTTQIYLDYSNEKIKATQNLIPRF